MALRHASGCNLQKESRLDPAGKRKQLPDLAGSRLSGHASSAE